MDTKICVKNGVLSGEFLDPHTYLKIVNHSLRKRILHRLFEKGVEGHVRKKDLAADLNVDYHRLIYQFNEHLKEFWMVKEERKIRGVREELIMPINPNAIYCNVGRDAVINIIDPLANIFGRLNVVGTRCDSCEAGQRKECVDRVVKQGCAVEYLKSAKKRDILAANDRKKPYTPIDYILACTITGVLDGEKCIINSKPRLRL